jgi:hypothetical protein
MAGQTRGQHALVCLPTIPLLSLPLLAALLLALRHGAPTSRGAAGVRPGSPRADSQRRFMRRIASTIGAPWYTIAIGAVTVSGAMLGRRLLRW